MQSNLILRIQHNTYNASCTLFYSLFYMVCFVWYSLFYMVCFVLFNLHSYIVYIIYMSYFISIYALFYILHIIFSAIKHRTEIFIYLLMCSIKIKKSSKLRIYLANLDMSVAQFLNQIIALLDSATISGSQHHYIYIRAE